MARGKKGLRNYCAIPRSIKSQDGSCTFRGVSTTPWISAKRHASWTEGPTPIWTQGATFAFKPGDLVYDTEKAYEEWSVALQHIGVAVQVQSAIDATSSQPGVARAPGSVTFDVLLPNADRSRLVSSGCRTLTQDDFVRMLITGHGLTRRQD